MIHSFALRNLGLRLAAWCLLVLIPPFARSASPLPPPLPNWRIEVVAEAPKLQHPSVVACAPDGRVFVAEDPMDISLPKADAAEGRILCLFPDGQITVFAEKLYAVFGLQYLEGKLYVLHNPRFSVFEDDHGVGRNRRELIEQTLPDPSALNWNDHIPANFRLGMDGFFYVATGDKGLHGAKGTDGSQADLFTGGIFRIRPDGSQLGVVAHGVRNVLDVALNAEDELFTYDNTDEHDWMGRFTHMVEAGFYGYPHDFIPQRPSTLWMMDDFGAGAACGAFANNEDALPPEFQGNVFLSDFGKRQILRVRIERSAGTYRTVSKEDLFPNPPGDFRPVGITLGPDGKSIYVCDWQHRDEKAKVSVGRLLRLTWIGPDHSAPKPSWYAPATVGTNSEAATPELVRGLSHPSYSVRLTAQRRLTDRGASGELVHLLEDRTSPAVARTHALWALNAIDGGVAARKQILEASADPDPRVRRQAIRQLGTQRAGSAVTALLERLRDPDASVRFQAATALGRIGDPSSVSSLLPALEEPDLFTRYAVFTALNRIGTNAPTAWATIVSGLESNSARVREGTRFAAGQTYDGSLLKALVSLFHDTGKSTSTRQAALDLIVAISRRAPGWKGEWWAYHPALQPPPAKTERWAGTDLVLATLRAGLKEPDPTLRRTCIGGLAAGNDTDSASALREIFPHESDPATRATILRALAEMKDPGTLALVEAELKQPSHEATTLAAITAAEKLGGERATAALSTYLGRAKAEATSVAQAIASLGRIHAKSAIPAIEPWVVHSDGRVRSEALIALSRLQGDGALPRLQSGLQDAELVVRRSVVQALSDLKSTNAIPALLVAYADATLRAEALAAMTRTPDERALDALLDGISSRNPVERNAAHLAIRDIHAKVLKAIEAKAASLSPQALTELRQIYAGNKAAENGPIFAREITQHSVEEYLNAALKLPGESARGEKLFSEPGGINCIACHRVAGHGSDLGPDLSAVGTQFDRRALAEAILYPSKTVREGYQQITIEMSDDEEFNGVVKGETADTLTLRDSSGREHKLARSLIKSRRNSALSLMPEGLQAALTLEDFADLVAYLSSLRPSPSPGTLPARPK